MQTVVNLSRLRHNVRRIKAQTRNGFCAVVKANAYGHGIGIAPFIEPVVNCFMVATADEAFELALTVNKSILTLGGDISQYLRLLSPNIVPTVCDAQQLDAIVRAGYKRFSVAINTGMNRLGADERKLADIVSYCKDNNVVPWSVYSHLYSLGSAVGQSEEFERLTENPILRENRHLYCSNALDLDGFDLFGMTRAGIAMYGYSRYTDIAMRVRAKIVGLSRVSKGEHVGYGDYVIEKDSLIATVRCGYADGLRRTDKQLYLKVRGVKCPIIGVPCMDLCMIDVTNLPCRVGEYAYLIADKEDAEYLAKCYGTIVYEVLTGFNGRTQRFYI